MTMEGANRLDKHRSFIGKYFYLMKQSLKVAIKKLVRRNTAHSFERYYKKYGSILNPSFGWYLEFTAKHYFEDLNLSEKDFEGKRVLDIGANDGAFLAYLSQRVKLKEGSTSLDIDSPPVNQDGTDFVVSDARQLPFKNDSFDLVLSHCSVPNMTLRSLSNFEEQYIVAKSFFDEMIRVLALGGTIAVYPVTLSHKGYESMETMPYVYLKLRDEYLKQGLEFDFEPAPSSTHMFSDFVEVVAILKIRKKSTGGQ